MRRATRLCSRLLLLTALLWSGLWLLGRERLSAEFDAGLDRMRAGGFQIAVSDHAITGFPFAYAAELRGVTLHDPGSGATTALPRLRSSVAVTAPDRLVTELPERFTISLPVPPMVPQRGGGFRAVPGAGAEFVVESHGAVLITEGLMGGGLRLTLQAEMLSLSPAQATGAFAGLSLDLAGAVGEVRMAGDAGGARATFEAARLDYRLGGTGAAGAAMGIGAEGSLRGFGAQAWTSATDMAGIERLLRGTSSARGEIALTADEHSLRLEETGAAGPLTLDGRDLALRLAMEGGGMDASAVLGPSRAALGVLPAEGPEGASPGALTAERVLLATRLPLLPGPIMRPIAFSLDLRAVAPDDALWSMLDPGAALPREPGSAQLTLDGTGRFTRPPAQRRPGEAVPLELGNLSLTHLEVAGLGARAEGRGDVEFLQPQQQPIGEVTVRLSGALSLIRALHAAGLITQQMVQTLATTAALYTRAGDGPDDLRVDIALEADGMRINDQRYP